MPAAARLVVIGDSLTFHGPDGPLPLDDARLYPNLLGARLAAVTGQAWDVAVVARAGWCSRDVWLALQRDVHLQQRLLVGAGAVVLAATSADSLPVGVPRPLLALLPFVRPTSLRRRLRRGLDRSHPALVRATGARLRYTPLAVYRHCWRKSVDGVRLFAPRAAVCAIVPALHRAGYYAGAHPHHAAVAAATIALAERQAVPLVDLPALMAPWMDALNPDGMHWAFGLHADVADAMAAALLPQLVAAPQRLVR